MQGASDWGGCAAAGPPVAANWLLGADHVGWNARPCAAGLGPPTPAADARRFAPPPGEAAPRRSHPACAPLQVVVLDKLDYCATLNNLAAVRNAPNFK